MINIKVKLEFDTSELDKTIEKVVRLKSLLDDISKAEEDITNILVGDIKREILKEIKRLEKNGEIEKSIVGKDNKKTTGSKK